MITFLNVIINIIAFIIVLLSGTIVFGSYSDAIEWNILYIEIGLLIAMILLTIAKLIILKRRRLRE